MLAGGVGVPVFSSVFDSSITLFRSIHVALQISSAGSQAWLTSPFCRFAKQKESAICAGFFFVVAVLYSHPCLFWEWWLTGRVF